MAVARLRYLSTNCTLTFGSSNCRLLIFFPEWNQWDFSWGRLEKRRTRHFESKVKATYGTLPCCDVFSVLHLNCIIFRQICVLTLDILFPSPPTQRSSWLMRSVFAIRRHASRLWSQSNLFLSSCFCFESVLTDHWQVQIFSPHNPCTLK